MTETLLSCLERGDTLVTATRRLARRCRELHDGTQVERGLGGWRPADTLTWDAWIERSWRRLRDFGHLPGDRRLLAPAQERTLWERELARSGLALMMPGQAAAEAMQAHRLLRDWRIEAAEVESRAGPDTRAFLALRRSVLRRCREQGWLLAADLPGLLAEAPLGRAVSGRITLAGFDDLSPAQERLLGRLREAGVAVAASEPVGRSGARVRVAACQDRVAETWAAADWARGVLADDPDARIAIVLADLDERAVALCHALEDLVEPALALPGSGARARPWNLSLGPALAEWPVADAAFLGLSLWSAPGEYARVGRLLRSPYLGGGVREAQARARLDVWLRGQGTWELDLGGLSALLVRPGGTGWNPRPECPDLAGRLAALPSPGGPGERRTAGEWAGRFTDVLSALGWPGERELDSAEYQCVRKWRALLDDFSGLEPVAGTLSRGAALDALRRLAAETPFQPEREPAPVQVMGLLETAGLEFDALWVGGLEDQAWPRPLRHNALLPAALQRETGMPRACPAGELEFARRSTGRLAASAEAVVFSWPAMEGEEALRPSPLLAAYGEPGERLTRPPASPWTAAIRAASRMETLDDYRAPAGGSGIRGGASILRSQSACPFQAQALWRLRSDPLEVPVQGVSPLQRGAVAHRALEILWRAWGSRDAAARLDPGERARAVRDAVEAAVTAELPAGNALQRALAEVEAGQVARHVLALVAADLERPDFSVEEVEGRHELELEGLALRLRVDRVDGLASGGRLVIDYKTGQARPSDWLGERPAEPQLPLYALAAGAEVRGVAFGRLAPGETGYAGLADGESAGAGIAEANEKTTAGVGDWEALVAAWRASLGGLAAGFVAGDARVDPRRISQDCARCHLRGLCRRDELEAWGVIGDE